jgi:benzoyl-CoA reductase subunit C
MDTVEHIVSRCQELIEDMSFRSVAEWKEAHPGGKVLGYFPVYFPVELAHAAGMLPVAIYGGGNRIPLKQADAHMYSFMCSVCKSTLELGLSKRLAMLDLFVGTPICDAARHMPGLMERNVPGLVVEILYTPANLRTELAVPYLAREFQRLRELLVSVVGHPIEDAAIRASIAAYNEVRRLVRRIYELRHQSPWLITATESYAVVRAGTLMPVDEYLPLLREFVVQAAQRHARPLDKIRVVYEGAFCEQPPIDFIRALEEVCYVVDDDFTLGAQLITVDTEETGDPLLSLAKAYRDGAATSSVQHDMRQLKSDGLLKKYRDSGAQALILSPPKFCEPGLDDQVHHLKRAEKEGIPFLQMEFQERMKDFDSVRTQTETFAEALLFYTH